MDFGVIARVFGPKFLRPRKNFKFSVRIAPKNARNLALRGTLMLAGDIADLLATRQGRASPCIVDLGAIARFFRTEIFAAANKFQNFRSESR